MLSRLELDGCRFWYDQGIFTGEEWHDEVMLHLRKAFCIIAFISKKFIMSKNCIEEIITARNIGKTIIPIYIDCLKVPEYIDNFKFLTELNSVFALDLYNDMRIYEKIYSTPAIETCRDLQNSTHGGWGPEREMYCHERLADHAAFNSLRDNAAVGDERDFVRIVEIGTKGAYKNTLKIQAGKEYQVWVYYNNCAHPVLNKEENGYIGVARDTKLSVSFPPKLLLGVPDQINAIISWRCAPIGFKNFSEIAKNKVWASAGIMSDTPVKLYYKVGSAKIFNGYLHGKVLPTTLFSSNGTFIGMTELNGVICGGSKYSGQVVFTLVAKSIENTND